MSRHRGRRFAALALALGVPAFAAPAEWHGFSGFEQARAETVEPMGFETAGQSFPGSAFYYLADEPNMTAEMVGPVDTSAAGEMPVPSSANPAARPFAAGGSQLDKSRALQCMTMAIYYEAASESDAGQRAVAQVVLNRVAHPSYPDTVCGVVFQGSERRTGCQFTFTCDGSLARQPSRRFWDRAQKVAARALAGSVYAPVGLATHYHTLQVNPYWASSLSNITTIGAHTFYRWSGMAGRPGAFNALYAGNEPLPARRRGSNADREAADPVELARQYEQTHPAAAAQEAQLSRPIRQLAAAISPQVAPPSYAASVEARGGDAQFTANRLPGAGEVRSEYAQSGQWKDKP